jgi:hypothetical protein
MKRDDVPQSDGSSSILGGPNNLSGAQAQWLTQQLAASPAARWKIIISSLAFNPTAKNSAGSWGNFQTQRGWLVSWLTNPQNGIKNVVFVSGDLHSGGAIDNGLANSGTAKILPVISVLHTNIKQPADPDQLPYENLDTGCLPDCSTCQSGTWNVGYRSGRSGTGRCGYDAGGPGYVLLKVDNTHTPDKQLILEVRDAITDTVQLTYTLDMVN